MFESGTFIEGKENASTILETKYDSRIFGSLEPNSYCKADAARKTQFQDKTKIVGFWPKCQMQ